MGEKRCPDKHGLTKAHMMGETPCGCLGYHRPGGDFAKCNCRGRLEGGDRYCVVNMNVGHQRSCKVCRKETDDD